MFGSKYDTKQMQIDSNVKSLKTTCCTYTENISLYINIEPKQLQNHKYDLKLP